MAEVATSGGPTRHRALLRRLFLLLVAVVGFLPTCRSSGWAFSTSSAAIVTALVTRRERRRQPLAAC
jgi:hypothetical protein